MAEFQNFRNRSEKKSQRCLRLSKSIVEKILPVGTILKEVWHIIRGRLKFACWTGMSMIYKQFTTALEEMS